MIGPAADDDMVALVYICAYQGDRLVGFVKLAWDGGIHTFLLEPTVHPQWQRRGLGRQLVEQAVEKVRQRGMEWVHVDYDPELRHFYDRCGFQPTEAGLIPLTNQDMSRLLIKRVTPSEPQPNPSVEKWS